MHPWERVGWAFVEQWTLDFSLFLQYRIADLEIKEMWPAQGEGVLGENISCLPHVSPRGGSCY